MKISFELVALGLVSLPGVAAWGELGHETAAYIAGYFVSNSTAAYLKDLLGNQDDDYLASIATWADDIKKKRPFTRNFHFIDAHDNPESQDCNVDYNRDCKKGGCVISALTNYTEQAIDRQLPKEEQRQEAVKFLVHFIGDLHQPLHNEDVGRGGTQINVKWESRSDDLHAVWDTHIPEKVAEHLKNRGNNLALEWASELVDEILNGKFAAEKNNWLTNFDLSDPLKTSMDWSVETNHLVCDYVFPKPYGPKQIVGKQLSGSYYNKAGPVVEKQIARAGYRMAAWLDEIARNNWPGEDNGEL